MHFREKVNLNLFSKKKQKKMQRIHTDLGDLFPFFFSVSSTYLQRVKKMLHHFPQKNNFEYIRCKRNVQKDRTVPKLHMSKITEERMELSVYKKQKVSRTKKIKIKKYSPVGGKKQTSPNNSIANHSIKMIPLTIQYRKHIILMIN